MARELNEVIYELRVEDRGGTQAIDRQATALDRLDDAGERATTGLRALDQATVTVTRSSASAANAWARWQATADPAVRAAQQLARAQADIDRAVRQGLATQEQASRVMAQLQQRYTVVSAANENFAQSAGRAATAGRGMGSAIQNAGFQVGDFAVQVASGSGVMRPLIQQGTQLISMFGPWGAVIGAAGAILGALISSLDVFGDEAADAAEQAKKFEAAIDAVHDVLDRVKSLGNDLSSARQTEMTDLANMARYYASLTDEVRAYERALIDAKLHEAEQGAISLREQLRTTGGDIRGAVVPRAAASVSFDEAGAFLAQTAPVLRQAAEAHEELLGILERAQDTSQGVTAAAMRAVVDLTAAVSENGRLSEAAIANADAASRDFLQSQREAALEARAAAIEIAEQGRTYDDMAEAARKAQEVIDAPPDEQSRLANLPEAMKAAADAAKEAEREFEKMNAELARAGEANLRRENKLDDYIEGLEIANELEQLSTEEKRVQEAILRAQALLVNEQGHAIRQLTETEEQRIRNAVLTADAIAAQKRAVEEMDRTVRDMTDDVVDYGATAFADMFSQTEGGWREMWETMRRTAIQTLARIAAEALLRPIIQPVVAQLVGAAPSLFGIEGSGGTVGAGSGSGGLGSLFNLPTPPIGSLFGNGSGIGSFLNTPIFGTSGLPATTAVGHASLPFGAAPGAFTSGSFLPSFTFGNALGGIGIGASLGGLLSSLTGGNQIGGTIGGGVGGLAGAAIGSIIPGIGTALGAAVGGGLLGVVGSLFGGGKPSVGPNAGANIDWLSGQVRVSSAGADNGGNVAQARSLAQGVADAVNALAAELGATRVAVGGYQFGTFGGQFVGRLGGNVFTQGADADRIVQDTLFKMLRGGSFQGLDPMIQGVISRSGATSIDALIDDIQFARALADADFNPQKLTAAEQAIKAINEQFDELADRARRLGLSEAQLVAARDRAIAQLATDFDKGIRLQILGITDPLKAALETLGDAQEERLREARALGADLVEVERLHALERAEVLKQQLGDLRAWLDGQALASTATTGVGRLAEAQAQFGAVVEAIRGGSTSAADISRLTGLADTIIGLAGQLYGGTAQHAALERMVRSTVEQIGKQLGLPGFAAGGFHQGGWRIVGEHGPELEFTPPSRIFSAPQTRGMLDDRRNDARLMLEQTAELRSMSAAIESLAAENRRLNTMLSRLLTAQASKRAA